MKFVDDQSWDTIDSDEPEQSTFDNTYGNVGGEIYLEDHELPIDGEPSVQDNLEKLFKLREKSRLDPKLAGDWSK